MRSSAPFCGIFQLEHLPLIITYFPNSTEPRRTEQFFNFRPVIPSAFISAGTPPPRHVPNRLTDKSKRHFERKIPHKASHIPHPIQEPQTRNFPAQWLWWKFPIILIPSL